MRVSPGRKQISKENICETQNVHVMNNSWCKISQMEKQEIVEIVQLLETFLSFFRGNKTTHPEIMTDQPTICTRSHPPAKFNLPKSPRSTKLDCPGPNNFEVASFADLDKKLWIGELGE